MSRTSFKVVLISSKNLVPFYMTSVFVVAKLMQKVI